MRAVEQQKLQDMRTQKLTQQLHETSPELQQLARQLQTAYVTKERETQLAEKKAIAQYEENRVQQMQVEIVRAREIRNRELDAREEIRLTNQLVGKEILDAQLEERETRRREAYEQFLKDKEMVDSVTLQVRQQEEKEVQERMEKSHASRESIVRYMEAREKWRAAEKRRQDEETRKILEYMEQKQRDEDAAQERKKSKERERDALHDVISQEMTEKRRRQEELDNLKLLYYRELEEARRRELDRLERKKKVETRAALQAAFLRDTSRREAVAQERRIEEEQFRRSMMEKFAEDERIDQLNAQARRTRQMAHRKAVEEMIHARRHELEAAREAEKDIMRDIFKQEAQRDDAVEAERKRLIREHAVQLLGYLPKGVLQDRDLDEIPAQHHMRAEYSRR